MLVVRKGPKQIQFDLFGSRCKFPAWVVVGQQLFVIVRLESIVSAAHQLLINDGFPDCPPLRDWDTQSEHVLDVVGDGKRDLGLDEGADGFVPLLLDTFTGRRNSCGRIQNWPLTQFSFNFQMIDLPVGPLVGEILFSSVPPSNSLISISDTRRAI